MRRIARIAGIAAIAVAIGAAPVARAEKVQSIAALKPAPGGERRVALVIGNGAYKDAPLRNPVNDARAISKALSESGFSVTLIEDAALGGMRRAIRNFGDELAKSKVGIFYYAGHGMQVRGVNYLIPVNADIEREDEIADQAIDANLVLAKMDSAKNALNIMILDACRNNPFARSFRSAARGLAQMDAPTGTLISFATAPGSVASDGSGANGLYTEHLLKAIREPGLPIEQVFKQVRIGVTKATADQQVPWESSSLKGDFFFTPPDPNAGAAVQKAAIDKAVTDAVLQAEEKAAKERGELQSQMQQMKALIEQMLAKQKAEFEEELKKRSAAQASAAAQEEAARRKAELEAKQKAELAAREKAEREAHQRAGLEAKQRAELEAKQRAEREALAKAAERLAPPVQVAAIAPAGGITVRGALLPAAGDRWEYDSYQTRFPDKKHRLTVEVKAVIGESVLETRQARETWVYTPGAAIIGSGNPGVYNFSPYLLAFQEVRAGDSWREIPFQRLGKCSDDIDWYCKFEGKVIGTEKVTIAAGTFDALRIEIDQSVATRGGGVHRKAIYWYAPAVKRHVKAAWKTISGSWGGEDVEAELVSYKLN